MDQGKVAHYRNQNVLFDVDFIAKRNFSCGTGSAKKKVGNFACRKTLRIWSYIKLYEKGQSFTQRMMKKTIFEISVFFQKMRLFKIPVKSPVLQISEDLVFF